MVRLRLESSVQMKGGASGEVRSHGLMMSAQVL